MKATGQLVLTLVCLSVCPSMDMIYQKPDNRFAQIWHVEYYAQLQEPYQNSASRSNPKAKGQKLNLPTFYSVH